MALSAAVTAALISGGAALASTGASIGASAARNKKQQKFRKEEIAILEKNADENAALAYERQKELLADDRAYNDPSAVAARYQAAGISPHSAFGSGAASGSGISHGASSVPEASPASGGTPSLSMPDFGGLSNAGVAIGNALIQDEKLKNERRSIDAQNALLEQQARGLEIENKYKEQSEQLQLRAKLVDIYKDISETDKNSAERDKLVKQAQEIEQQIKESEERIANMQQERRESESRVDKNKQEVKESQTRTDKTKEEIELMKVANAWEKRFGWKPGDSWMSIIPALYGRMVVQTEKLSDKFTKFLKSLFTKKVSSDVVKKVAPVLNSSMSESEKQSKIEEILKKNGYNDKFE